MKLHIQSRRRTAIAAVVAALAITVPTVAAQADVSPRAQTSAGFLKRELAANGSHFETSGYPDYGLTLDSILAMDAAGVGDYGSDKATDYVASNIRSYISDGDPGHATTEQYAGATAKALLVSLSQRVSPKGTLGGVNLVAKLRARENSNGRFRDKSAYGDYSNTIGQSLALVSLKRVGVRLTTRSTTFLNKQQCPNGGFRIQMANTACTNSATADTDATSFAVQGLLAEPNTTARRTRISKAIAYLRTRMNSSGGVSGGSPGEPTNTPNSNSTGLAMMSFVSTGHNTLAHETRTYLISMRFVCRYPERMRGAVAYDASRKEEATAQGANAAPIDQDRRSTAQAVLGFAGKSLLQITNAGAMYGSPHISC